MNIVFNWVFFIWYVKNKNNKYCYEICDFIFVGVRWVIMIVIFGKCCVVWSWMLILNYIFKYIKFYIMF